MKKTTAVALLLLMSNVLSADKVLPEITNIESQWARIYYNQSSDQKKTYYPQLIERIKKISKTYPHSTELKIWEALVIATNAEFESPFTALDSINEAKTILEKAIQTEPESLDGAAFVILGTLYYLTPGWPISFGDQNRAEDLLKKALEINPDSIDANYFYGDYLLTKNKIRKAQKYFKQALMAPNRPDQQYADEQLKKEAYSALKSTELRKLDSGRNNFLSLFSSVKKD